MTHELKASNNLRNRFDSYNYSYRMQNAFHLISNSVSIQWFQNSRDTQNAPCYLNLISGVKASNHNPDGSSHELKPGEFVIQRLNLRSKIYDVKS